MLFEIFTAVGSAFGLAATALAIRENLTKNRPLFVFTTSEPYIGGQRDLILRVLNRSDRLLMLRAEKNPEIGHFRLMLDDTTHSAVGSALGLGLSVAVSAHSECRFHLMNPPDFKDIPPDHDLFLRVMWRFAEPILNLPERPRTLRIQKRDAEVLTRGDGYDFT